MRLHCWYLHSAPMQQQEPLLEAGADNHDEESLRLKQAAACLVCAFKGTRVGLQQLYTTQQYRAQRIFHNLWLLRLSNTLVFLSISFFEPPSWCYPSYHSAAAHGCIAPNDTHMPMVRLPWATRGTACAVEILCISIFCGEVALKYYYEGRQWYFRNWKNRVRIGLLFLALLDTTWTAAEPSHFRLGMYLRPTIVVVFSAKLQRSFKNIVRVMPFVFDVGCLLAYLLAFYSTCGLLIFHSPGMGGEGPFYFSSFAESLLSLFILLTTSNSPAIMIPVYEQHAVSALFFISFFCFGHFFLMSLILATIYSNFKQHLRLDRLRTVSRCRLAISEAFDVLDTHQRGRMPVRFCRRLLVNIR